MRLLKDGEWFTKLSSSALYETEYEHVIMQQSGILFPSYLMVDFKTVVTSDTDSAKADCALVSETYKDWWVVEIELSHHSLTNHVLPQVITLANGYYEQRHAEWIGSHSELLETPRLRDLIRGRQPRVLVIADAESPGWEAALARHGAALAIVEIYMSNGNRFIYRLTGDYPQPPSAMVTDCRPDSHLPGCLIVDAPASLGGVRGCRYRIEFEGCITEWTRLESADRVWLAPMSSSPLRHNLRYEIHRLSGGLLAFVESSTKGGRE